MILNLDLQDGESKLSGNKYRMFLALLQDIVDDFPKAVKATISSNILLPGRTHLYLDALTGTVEPTGAAGESQGTIELEINPEIEGISRASLEWAYKINGQRVIAIWENCTTRQKFIGGSPCSGGLLVTVSNIGKLDNGMMGIKLNMKGNPCPEPYYFYDGPIIREAPAVVPADATTFALTPSVQYQLSDYTAAKTLSDITNVTNDDVGRVIEILGAGTTNAAKILPSSKFVLNNGVDFTASAGSSISLRIMKTGASSFAFVELFRF